MKQLKIKPCSRLINVNSSIKLNFYLFFCDVLYGPNIQYQIFLRIQLFCYEGHFWIRLKGSNNKTPPFTLVIE